MNKLKWMGWIAAGAVVVLTAGCQNNNLAGPPPETRGEVFVPDSDLRAITNVRLAQAASGARKDAMLHPAHFDDQGLNSLGEQKLDLMLSSEEPAEPFVVYLDLPAGAPAGKDRDAVVAYLKDRGLQESQILVKNGPNPASNGSAATASANLQALQAAPQGGAQTGTGSTPAASAGNPQPTYQSH